jgi:hypothetical protein
MKYLLIFGILIYVFYKIGSFFFKAGAAAQQLRNFQNQSRPNGKANTAKGKEAKVKGGEYIDYEEVK